MRAITKLFVSMTVTGAAAVSGLAAFDAPALITTYRQQGAVVSAQNSCRALDFAILAYTTRVGREPTSISQLPADESVDFSAYRIEGGRATGPGCVGSVG